MIEADLVRMLKHDHSLYKLAKGMMNKKRFEIFEAHYIRRIWYIRGVVKYNLDKNVLKAILLKLKLIGCVPKGYCYPELNCYSQMPDELLEFTKRKEINKQKIAMNW